MANGRSYELKVPFSEFYEKLRYPLFPTTRLNRGTRYYRVGNVYNIYIKQKFEFKALLISIQAYLLKEINELLSYYDILTKSLKVVEMDRAILFKAKEDLYYQFEKWYNTERNKHLWRKENTSVILLILLNIDMLVGKWSYPK